MLTELKKTDIFNKLYKAGTLRDSHKVGHGQDWRNKLRYSSNQ